MSLLDENILEKIDIYEIGFPKKNEYYKDYRVLLNSKHETPYEFDHMAYGVYPNMIDYNNHRYWSIDNEYLWHKYGIKTIIVSVSLIGDINAKNHIHKIIIGISKNPIKYLLYKKNFETITETECKNKSLISDDLYLFSINNNLNWLCNEFAEWTCKLSNEEAYDRAYNFICEIKKNPEIINKIIENKLTEENKETHRTLRLKDLI